MVRKVELFETNDIWKLQERVNKFLETISHWDVIDIRYSLLSSQLPRQKSDWNVLYTAMVIYTDHNYGDSSVPQGIEMDKDQGYAVRRPL